MTREEAEEFWADDEPRPDYEGAIRSFVDQSKAVGALERERDELRAEVERLTGALTDNEQAYTKRVAAWSREKARAEKAEATVARVEAICADPDFANGHVSVVRIRAALKGDA